MRDLLHGLRLAARGFARKPGFLAGSRYRAAVVDFFEQLRQRVEALPEVAAGALTDQLPLAGPNWTSDFAVEGRGPEEYGVEAITGRSIPTTFRPWGCRCWPDAPSPPPIARASRG